MNWTRNSVTALAGAGSLSLLLGAWFFQYVIGLAPCAMCYWQRWPHIAAVVIAVLAVATLPRPVALGIGALGALAAGASAAIGAFHSGVERGWWPGPASCTSGGLDMGSLSGADLLDLDAAATLVMCDEISWTFVGLSMANWNVVVSLGLAAVWIVALRLPERRISAPA